MTRLAKLGILVSGLMVGWFAGCAGEESGTKNADAQASGADVAAGHGGTTSPPTAAATGGSGGGVGAGGGTGTAGAAGHGGTAATGGATAVGGSTAIGGATTGTGGATRAGGAVGTGGKTGAGGATRTGGTTAAGGATQTGGTTQDRGTGGSGSGGAGGRTGETCGGYRGAACTSATDVCETPPGQCCCDIPGTCTPRPQGCTMDWRPVCGCDGQTYGNDCARLQAGMSKDHDGECQSVDAGTKDIAAERDVPMDLGPDRSSTIMTPTLPAACKTSADCCVAMDGCMAKAYLVGKDEYSAMVASIANHDTGGMCASCVHPAVQVQCQAGFCVGELMSFYAEGTPFDNSHCGTITMSDASAKAAAAPFVAGDGDAGTPRSVWTCGS
jgi:hypothetical protein